MKAVAYKTPGPITADDALVDVMLDKPIAEGRDILVKIAAVSVNPVDTKVRNAKPPVSGEWGVVGYDGVGTVDAIGADVSDFKVGDEVFYAGSIARQGTNSEFHLVDERIAGHKPTSLSNAEAAALPLTAITAWEMLFDRLNVNTPTAQGGNLILVIGGAGGVGSITIQLLRALTDLTIITTASRPETKEWAIKCGAHHVIDHSKLLAPQVEALGLGAPGFVFSTTQTEKHFDDIAVLIAPQGRFGLIDGVDMINIIPMKTKSVSIHWEFMFTRAVFETPDMGEQGKLLNEISRLVDAGKIRSTLTEVAGKINAETLRKVHAQIESGTTRGKVVLEGF